MKQGKIKMKYITIILILLAMTSWSDNIDELEQQYVNKAESLKASRDKYIQLRDKKYNDDSKSLARSYLKSLKAIEVLTVKKGDLDGALKIRAKIKEIEAALTGHQVVPEIKSETVSDEDIELRDKLVGFYYYWGKNNGKIRFNANGVLWTSWGSGLRKWRAIKDNKVELTTNDGGSKAVLEIAPDLSFIRHVSPRYSAYTIGKLISRPKIEIVDKETALGYKLKRHPIGQGAVKGLNGHYYKFVKEAVSWKTAFNKAKELGGYLAVPTTKKEFEFIREQSKESKGYVWIGGHLHKGNHKWITGETSLEEFTKHERAYGVYLALYGTNQILATTGTGKNSAGNKWLTGGYVIEWDE